MKRVKIKADMDNTKEEIEENKVGAPEKDKNLDSQVINFKDGITIYEGKMTAVIIGAVITLIFSLVMYYYRQDISDNLTFIVITFICSITGVSGLEQVIGSLKGQVKKKLRRRLLTKKSDALCACPYCLI